MARSARRSCSWKQEGLVVTHPYRGAVVAEIPQKEIEEILVPIRLVIEKAAFRAAAEAADEELFGALDGLVRQMESAAADPLDAKALADLDVAFHEAVIAAGGQTQSLRIWRTIQSRVRAHFIRDASHHESPRGVVDQHRSLLDTLRSGEPERAGNEIAEHIGIYLDH